MAVVMRSPAATSSATHEIESTPPPDRYARGWHCLGLAQDLFVPGSLVVRVQQQVGMAFDETWQQSRPGQRDRDGIGRRGDLRSRANGGDAPVAHEYRPTVVWRIVGAGPNAIENE